MPRNRGQWTQEEDEAIGHLLEQANGRKWASIARSLNRMRIGLPRTGKQVRTRWNNFLDPTLKRTPWTEEEEMIIVQKQKEVGNKWSEIARFLPGRSDAHVKNHWYATLRKTARMIAKESRLRHNGREKDGPKKLESRIPQMMDPETLRKCLTSSSKNEERINIIEAREIINEAIQKNNNGKSIDFSNLGTFPFLPGSAEMNPEDFESAVIQVTNRFGALFCADDLEKYEYLIPSIAATITMHLSGGLEKDLDHMIDVLIYACVPEGESKPAIEIRKPSDPLNFPMMNLISSEATTSATSLNQSSNLDFPTLSTESVNGSALFDVVNHNTDHHASSDLDFQMPVDSSLLLGHMESSLLGLPSMHNLTSTLSNDARHHNHNSNHHMTDSLLSIPPLPQLLSNQDENNSRISQPINNNNHQPTSDRNNNEKNSNNSNNNNNHNKSIPTANNGDGVIQFDDNKLHFVSDDDVLSSGVTGAPTLTQLTNMSFPDLSNLPPPPEIPRRN
eukprot:TRINITY_DN137_c6_g1_i1.p1 TRINITY_DN137_c6_g1~~TRINITY_DN137_c6_g1_i1.p1  ORF type:complete len:504 (+),score=115.86 TRINITY_DN137_c6_g1_i1:132-1643(+)